MGIFSNCIKTFKFLMLVIVNVRVFLAMKKVQEERKYLLLKKKTTTEIIYNNNRNI